MRDLEESDLVANNTMLSVRTFHKYNDDLPTPHFAVITRVRLLMKAPKLFEQGWNLIVATCIDPKDCLYCGCVRIKELNLFDIEMAIGPGTVRRVTHDNLIDYARYDLSVYWLKKSYVPNIYKCNLEHTIIEWSVYNKPVGYLKQKFICWEITDDGTGKNKLFGDR